ncbi:FAD-dependent oxidoreductase [Clostridium sp. SYSU_GA19001]|uniref:FAD-dependent oxidoreductase n=1 Tax=Clostridium caldaquaticum TaxID=2940653 RepID=UPI0020779743|nr:FAD-dependent oxidoreductase [Clostridium caldaquaticum]MCM8711252.1 FAD-dependent oxidoreductase [Clostridium caldaquaticum]
MQKVVVTINGLQVEALQGQTILEAALKADIYIPHLCFHPDLKPQGGCKLCVVEIDGVDGAVTSCNTEVKNGMVIRTKTDKLSHLRTVAMELMLASHPADCTSCPVYLNCELQAMLQYLGVAHSRLRRIEKKNIKINASNPLIVRDMERCIQCGRCIRACSDIRGVGILQYNKNNGEVYVGTEKDLPLKEADCRFCGACVEVCPTGALRDEEGVFRKDIPREQALIPCKAECPAHTDIPTYVRLVSEGKYSDAVAVIREKLPFPGSLGYVCNHKCESACKRTKLNEPISIRNLKRYAVEHDTIEVWKEKAMRTLPDTGKKVAVVGAGPSGMTAALYLRKKGHAVTIFEKLPLAGGMLSVGIPEYRLPREIVKKEIDFIKAVGVEIFTNTEIKSVEELTGQGFDAVLIAIGAHKGRKFFTEGICSLRVYTAVDFLRKVSLKERIDLGEKVAVIGGGNVAFDCARTAVRLGVKEVNVICLESRQAMLADQEEIYQGEEEGVLIQNSKSTLKIEGTSEHIQGVRHIDVKNFSFDVEGKLIIEAVDGSESITEADTVIFAAGQYPDIDENFGIELNRGNLITVKGETMETSKKGVFAAGDAVYGTKSVIEAIASGRKAAESIDLFLGGNGDISEVLYEREKVDGNIGKRIGFGDLKREETAITPVQERKNCFLKIDSGFDEIKAKCEAGRCLQCDLRTDISKVKFWGDYKFK